MNIAKRLILLLAVPVVALVSLSVFLHFQLDNIEARGRYVADNQIPGIAKIGNITRTFGEMRVALRDYLLVASDAERAKALAAFHTDETDLNRILGEYADTLISDNRDRRLLEDYRGLTREWIVGAKKAMAVLAEGNRADAMNRVLGFMHDLGERINRVSVEWIQYNERLANEAGALAVTATNEARWKWRTAAVAVIAFISGLGYLTFRRIVVPIRALESSVKAIAAGDYSKQVPCTEARDETGGLARSVEVLKQSAVAIDEHRWVSASAAKLTGGLQGAGSLADFGQQLLSGLVPALGASVAGFYTNEGEPASLRRVVGYGLADGATLPAEIQPGEGLVGQCARERKSITIEQLPPDYLRITSGLGMSAPGRAVALPLLSQDTVLGVIELASFRAFSPRETALLDELLPVVAMSLEILQRNLRTKGLLEQTQKQTRELEVSSVELQQSQRELLAQRESIAASEARTRQILESTAEGIFGVDTKGQITFVNPSAAQMLGFTAAELIGREAHAIIHHH